MGYCGQNNHKVRPKSTVMMKQYLQSTGLFEVDVARTKFIWSAEREAAFLPLAGAGESEPVKDPQPDPNFKPDFKNYAVVISNFGWKAADWPEETQRAFEKYVAGGGGFVSVHAADNSWGDWTEFNKMIGVGGWGDRTEKDGPYVYYNNEGKIARDMSPGKAGSPAIDSLHPEGSTNAEAGIRLGYKMALRAYNPDGINRVILCSDGVANVGNTEAEIILDEIRGHVQEGVTMTTIGFGMDNYNDVLNGATRR